MLVEMKDLCKDYPQGKETVRVLKDICLEVEEGDSCHYGTVRLGKNDADESHRLLGCPNLGRILP